MTNRTTYRPLRAVGLGVMGVLCGAMSVAIVGAASGRQPAPPITEALAGPGVTVLPRLIYMGNPSCTGSACHSADTPKDFGGQMIGDEFNIWSDHDPHATAFRSLSDNVSKQIAAKLVVSHRTVESHVQNTLRKLQLHNRSQLVRYAIEQGLAD